MMIQLVPTDFDFAFWDPVQCPLARALYRRGYCDICAGTTEATLETDFGRAKLWESGVFLNSEKIDHPAFGFGPVEDGQIRRAFAGDPRTLAGFSLVWLS
ncbi:hypothetical protein V9K67_21665 [Paraflavisolibacter sp. H34]|uniref:hypothetical protein n=1 Tax=Huijunlia imazamoxiresistens TaxID=3127457 RepID=UPI003018BC1C